MTPYIKPIIAAVALAAAFAAGWSWNGSRHDAQIATIRQEQAEGNAKQYKAALDDLTAGAKQIRTAADQYAGVQLTLGTQLDAIQKDLKNVQAKAPLPAGCKPDAGRLRNLAAAVDAANQAAAR